MKAMMADDITGRKDCQEANALYEIGWCDSGLPSPFFDNHAHFLTALAMCAAIAGVKPEDVE